MQDLTFSQTQNEHINSTNTQPMYSNSTSTNKNTNSSPKNNNVHPHDQSTVILQQFSMITQAFRNFTVSGDITKIMQAYTAAQENTGKLIENAISQALTKPLDVTLPNPTIDSRTLEQTTHQTPLMKQTGPHPSKQIMLTYHKNLIMRCINHEDLMI